MKKLIQLIIFLIAFNLFRDFLFVQNFIKK